VNLGESPRGIVIKWYLGDRRGEGGLPQSPLPEVDRPAPQGTGVRDDPWDAPKTPP